MTEKIIDLAPYFSNSEDETFFVTIGRATYEVVIHFNPNGKQTVLEQFKELLLENGLVPHL